MKSLVLFLTGMSFLFSLQSCKKLNDESGLEGISGRDSDGVIKAAGLIAIGNVGEHDPTRVTSLGLLQCRGIPGKLTAESMLHKLEAASAANLLSHNNDAVCIPTSFAAGQIPGDPGRCGRPDYLEVQACGFVNNSAPINYRVITRAANAGGAIGPQVKTLSDDFLKAFITAQAFYLALRGPYVEGRTGSSIFVSALAMMEGIPVSEFLVNQSMKDFVFNPCDNRSFNQLSPEQSAMIRQQVSPLVFEENLKHAAFQCSDKNGRAEVKHYRVGGTGPARKKLPKGFRTYNDIIQSILYRQIERSRNNQVILALTNTSVNGSDSLVTIYPVGQGDGTRNAGKKFTVNDGATGNRYQYQAPSAPGKNDDSFTIGSGSNALLLPFSGTGTDSRRFTSADGNRSIHTRKTDNRGGAILQEWQTRSLGDGKGNVSMWMSGDKIGYQWGLTPDPAKSGAYRWGYYGPPAKDGGPPVLLGGQTFAATINSAHGGNYRGMDPKTRAEAARLVFDAFAQDKAMDEERWTAIGRGFKTSHDSSMNRVSGGPNAVLHQNSIGRAYDDWTALVKGWKRPAGTDPTIARVNPPVPDGSNPDPYGLGGGDFTINPSVSRFIGSGNGAAPDVSQLTASQKYQLSLAQLAVDSGDSSGAVVPSKDLVRYRDDPQYKIDFDRQQQAAGRQAAVIRARNTGIQRFIRTATSGGNVPMHQNYNTSMQASFAAIDRLGTENDWSADRIYSEKKSVVDQFRLIYSRVQADQRSAQAYWRDNNGVRPDAVLPGGRYGFNMWRQYSGYPPGDFRQYGPIIDYEGFQVNGGLMPPTST